MQKFHAPNDPMRSLLICALIHLPEQLARARKRMAAAFHIDHVTLQPELNDRIGTVAAPPPHARRKSG